MAVELGDRVRVLGFADGERTGPAVAGRVGSVVDRLQPGDPGGMVMVRFTVAGPKYETVLFYDWIDERHLVVF